MLRATLYAGVAVVAAAGASCSSDGGVCTADEVSALQTSTHGAPVKRRHVQKLHNFKDMEYSGDLKIGNQTLRSIYDTGSFEFLVVSQRCDSWCCNNNAGYFDQRKSRTFRSQKWTKVHNYGSGQCTTQMAMEQVSVPGYNGDETSETDLTSGNQLVWEVTSADMDILLDGSFGAVVGMGDPKYPVREVQSYMTEDMKMIRQLSDSNVPSWLQAQKDSDEQYSNVITGHPTILSTLGVTKFSVCYLKEPLSPGYFTWNDIDPKTIPGVFQTVAVSGTKAWSIPLTGVSLAGGRFPGGQHVACNNAEDTCSVLLDTGTSLVAAPGEAVMRLQAQLDEVGGRDCRNIHRMPDLKFELNGASFVLPPTAYIGESGGAPPTNLMRKYFRHLREETDHAANSCMLTMMTVDLTDQDDRTLWILGMPFFREYFTTFDLGDDDKYTADKTPRKVHFAPQDGMCNHPSQARSALDRTEMGKIRKVDLSLVRMPKWAERPHMLQDRNFMQTK